MPIPKRRNTRSSRNQRRSHHALNKLNLTTCSQCKESIKPHRVCLKCGTYAGKQVIDVESKEDKKSKEKPANKKDQKEKK